MAPPWLKTIGVTRPTLSEPTAWGSHGNYLSKNAVVALGIDGMLAARAWYKRNEQVNV